MIQGREDRIEAKLDAVADDIGEIKVTLGRQHEVLNEHMRRTEANERAVELLRKHHDMIVGAIKLLSVAAAVAALVQFFIKR